MKYVFVQGLIFATDSATIRSQFHVMRDHPVLSQARKKHPVLIGRSCAAWWERVGAFESLRAEAS
jgi:hypothetical protein